MRVWHHILSLPSDRVLWVLLVLLALLIISLFIVVLVLRSSWQISQTRLKKHRKIWQAMIMDFISEPDAMAKFKSTIHRRDFFHFGQYLISFFDCLIGEDRDALTQLACQLKVTAFFKTQLSSRNPWTRAYSAYYLGRVGCVASVPQLEKMLQDPHPSVAICAARALLSTPHFVMYSDVLRVVLRHKVFLEQLIEETFDRHGQQILTFLRKFLVTASSPQEKLAIVSLIGRFKDRVAITVLCQLAVSTEDPLLLMDILKALGEIGDELSIPILEMHLTHFLPEIRREAVAALGKLGNHHIMALLTSKLTDPDWLVRFQAARALVALGDVGHRLLELLQTVADEDASRRMAAFVLFEKQLLEGKKESEWDDAADRI